MKIIHFKYYLYKSCRSLILPLVFISTFAKSNEIDKIKNTKDIVNFMSENVDPEFNSEDLYFSKIERKRRAIAKPKIRFYKIDFDNNGLTDLLVEGPQLFAVVDKGNNIFKRLDLNIGKINKGFCKIDELTNINKEIKLTVSYPNDKDLINSKFYFIYKFGGFIEENLNVKQTDIDSVEYSINSFTCIENSSLIAKDLLVKTSSYEKCILTETSTLVNESSGIKQIFELITYMDISKLPNNFKVNWTDAKTSYLTVYFKNGDVKKIVDYGSQGTHGLALLYKLISDTSSFEK